MRPAGSTTPLLVTLVVAVFALTACTGSGDAGDAGTGSGGGSGDASDGAEASDRESTTTEPPPAMLAVVPNLGLAPSQCFADLDSFASPPTTAVATTAVATTTTTDPDAASTASTPEPTAPDTLPETTAVPRPAAIAVVDCAGTHEGRVYAAFCLGTDEDSEGELTAVACPGDPELAYPGDRTIRRAAARVCLQRFTESFGEDYATSPREASEFTPTEGVWELGDHRVVCTATESEIE